MTINLEQQLQALPSSLPAIQRERWIAAEALLEHCLRQFPKHAAALHLLGILFFSNNGLTKLWWLSNPVGKLDPMLGWNWFALGEVMIKLERFSEAVIAFECALCITNRVVD